MKKIILLASFLLWFCGCDSHDHEHGAAEAEQEIPAVVVTQWTDKMEIFMEYETPVAGNEIKFIIHLTTLADFQPVREGKVILYFEQSAEAPVILEKEEMLREGIFTPLWTFDKAGDYNFRITYQGKKAEESFDIGFLRVYPEPVAVPEQEEGITEEITYLKEQQWKTEFATEPVRRRLVKSSVKAIGEVHPRPSSYAEVTAPVEGIVSISASEKLVKPGQRIKPGQTMAVIVPPLAAENSWVKIYLQYEQAKTEFDRAQRLQQKEAISDRDFEQARRNYKLFKAGFENYFSTESGSLRFDSENNQFIITAPIAGIVSDVMVLPGQKVDRNEKMFSIIDPGKVWLKLELFADQAANLDDISGASIHIPGQNERINLGLAAINIISRGEMIDPRKRTITLWLETKNPDRRFLIGQTFSADIYTSPDQDMLTVPLSAIYDDNSQKVVYVHTSGESFEKRVLETWAPFNNYMAVLKGVKEGERVVSKGGYQVKLASASEEIGHPHTH